MSRTSEPQPEPQSEPPSEPTRPSAPPPRLRIVRGGAERRGAADQLSLPLAWSAAPGLPARPPAAGDLRVLDTTPSPAPEPAPEPDLPRAADWAARMARAIYEVSSGERPAAQLSRWVERHLLDRIGQRGSAMARHPSMRIHHGVSRLRKVRSVRVCTVAPGVVEASAVIVGMERSHAMALRMEITDGRWLITAIEMR